jgi:hypothetical protein
VADVWDSQTATWDSLAVVWDSSDPGNPSIWDALDGGGGGGGGVAPTGLLNAALLTRSMNPGVVQAPYATNISAASGNFCQIGGLSVSPAAYVVVGFKCVTGSGITAGTLTLQTYDGNRSPAPWPPAPPIRAA